MFGAGAPSHGVQTAVAVAGTLKVFLSSQKSGCLSRYCYIRSGLLRL